MKMLLEACVHKIDNISSYGKTFDYVCRIRVEYFRPEILRCLLNYLKNDFLKDQIDSIISNYDPHFCPSMFDLYSVILDISLECHDYKLKLLN